MMPQELNGKLKYLESRGYTVGNAAIAPDGLRVSIHGQLAPTEWVRLLAELEALKDDGATIDGDGLAYMAALCKQIAEHPSLDSRSADEAPGSRKPCVGFAESGRRPHPDASRSRADSHTSQGASREDRISAHARVFISSWRMNQLMPGTSVRLRVFFDHISRILVVPKSHELRVT
ncbi:MAG: hypothetical protein DMG39_30495 [Acidobacteria bacterium]|nr:MAG: hypothetical protein DMG39_30495 [Acidobacteriota bacterium]